MRHSIKELNKLYDAKYVDLVMDNDYAAGEALVNAVIDLFPNVKRVLDVGCNNGVHMHWFLQKGFVVEGVDISQGALDNAIVPEELIQIVDLREPIDFGKKYDLAYVVEVIEHIEEESSDQFIINLTTVAPIIIVTPGNQAGTGHFNMKSVSWWIPKFREHGMEYDAVMSNKLLEYLREPRWEEAQKKFPFMKKDIMVYRNEDSSHICT